MYVPGAGSYSNHYTVKDSRHESIHPWRCYENSGGNDSQRSSTESSFRPRC